MTILDRYIIKKFLGTFFFSLALFFTVAIIIDLVERVDDFVRSSAPLSLIISNYYLPFIPWIGAILFPLFVFIAVLFFTSKLAGQSEVIGMLGNSVSYYRLLVPYIVTSLFLAVVLYFANHYVVPYSNAKKLAFESTYFPGGYKSSDQNIHIRLSSNDFLFLENYNHRENEGYKFSFEKYLNGKLVSKISADKIEWDYVEKAWKIYNVRSRDWYKGTESFNFSESKIEHYPITPNDFERKKETKEAMTTPEIDRFIAQEEARGADNLQLFYVEKFRRTAACYSLLIMTLIGVAVGGRKSRGGTGSSIAIGLLLSASYVLFMQMSTTFANQAGLNPILGTWIPNILFTFIALLLLLRAQK